MITRSATLAGAALLAGVSVIGVGATAVHAEPSEEVKVDPCLATLLVDSEDKSATITVNCQETKKVGLELEADDLTLFSTQQTVAANVSQTFTVALPPVPRVCLTLEVDDEDEEVCVSTGLPHTPAPPENDDDLNDEEDENDDPDDEDETDDEEED